MLKIIFAARGLLMLKCLCLHLLVMLIGVLPTGLGAQQVKSTGSTVTLEELRFWFNDEPSVKAKISAASEQLEKAFPRWYFIRYSDSRMLAAIKGMDLAHRTLDGNVLLEMTSSMAPAEVKSGYPENDMAAYVFSLAFAAERLGSYVAPVDEGTSQSFYRKALRYYKTRNGTEPQEIHPPYAVGPLFKSLAPEDGPDLLFLSFYHFLPIRLEASADMAFDDLLESLDGVLSSSKREYAIGNYLANEVVYQLGNGTRDGI